jgi:hypothetical protein
LPLASVTISRSSVATFLFRDRSRATAAASWRAASSFGNSCFLSVMWIGTVEKEKIFQSSGRYFVTGQHFPICAALVFPVSQTIDEDLPHAPYQSGAAFQTPEQTPDGPRPAQVPLDRPPLIYFALRPRPVPTSSSRRPSALDKFGGSSERIWGCLCSPHWAAQHRRSA